MKRFLKNIVILLLPFAIIIGMVNFFVDPANIFSKGEYEQHIVEGLTKGHNLDNLKNVDERLLVQKFIEQTSTKPDIVAIGTSRSLEISSALFPQKKFINCSVSHGNMNDLIGIIGLLDSCKKLPAEIYLETSPTLIDPLPTDEWKTLYSYYNYGIKKMGLHMDSITYSPFSKFKKMSKALFSFEYFQKSIGEIGSLKKNNFKDVDTATPANFGRLADCSITYPLSYRTPDTVKAIADAAVYVNKALLPKVDMNHLKILEKIINYLKQKNVTVTLVNIPFQQDCYKIIEDNNNLFNNIKNNILSFAKQSNVSLIGTFNPYDANLNRSQFYDQLHCNKKAIKSVLSIVQYEVAK